MGYAWLASGDEVELVQLLNGSKGREVHLRQSNLDARWMWDVGRAQSSTRRQHTAYCYVPVHAFIQTQALPAGQETFEYHAPHVPICHLSGRW